MKAIATTPVGVFSRETERKYSCVNLYKSSKTHERGVTANGFRVTWHQSKAAADAAAGKVRLDSTAKFIGTFWVDADLSDMEVQLPELNWAAI